MARSLLELEEPYGWMDRDRQLTGLGVYPGLTRIADAISRAGGRALIVGGAVRDHLLEQESKDVDVEILGLGRGEATSVLRGFGKLLQFGRTFEVLRLKGMEVDFSVNEAASDFGAAARRRDLTINSMALDPRTGEVLDPHGGREDLRTRTLRATDAELFGQDPIRALRVAQFAARFEMQPDPELLQLCAAQPLSSVAGERLFEEFRKLLTKSPRPSLGLDVMRRAQLLRFFPELEALIDTPQDPEWHPEGDVWIHTLMVVDEAAALRAEASIEAGGELALMFSALCHDLGKPLSTETQDGRIKSHGHDKLGGPETERFLQRLRAPRQLSLQVCALVENHLAPALFIKNGAKARGYHRLARKLEAAGTSLDMLSRMARADHLGRTSPDALTRTFPAGDEFLRNASELCLKQRGPVDLVQGRHLVARGLEPGPGFGKILRRCRDLQDEAGMSDPDAILTQVLRERSRERSEES